MAALEKVTDWWQSLPFPWRPWRVVGYVEASDEVPERLPYKGVAVVGPPESAAWAVFECPCREGHRLMINLDKDRRPHWSIDCLKPLTIRPSIHDITPQRRCHFFVRGGRIKWAG